MQYIALLNTIYTIVTINSLKDVYYFNFSENHPLYPFRGHRIMKALFYAKLIDDKNIEKIILETEEAILDRCSS